MQECSGLPCVDVSAAGRTLRLLIDTGNPNSVLDQAIAQQLGLPLEPIVRNGKATGFSRTKLSHARISDLELDLPVTVMDVSGYVSKNQMPKADGTLGYKAFEGRALRLDYPHKSIEVSGPQSDCTGPCGKLSLITFGQHGPLGALPGHDMAAQAYAGLVSLNGRSGVPPGNHSIRQPEPAIHSRSGWCSA